MSTTQQNPSFQANQTTPRSSNSIRLGAGWNKTNKNGKPYISVKFNGGRPEDKYEVIVRNKETLQELPLAVTPVIVQGNNKKKDGKSPDFYLTAFYGSDGTSGSADSQ